MADRYWVGGSATWDSTAGTKWATTSGGAGGASAPTSADNVFLDAASGAVTVTLSTGTCLDLNCTGFTGTLAGSTLDIYGSMTLVSGMTRTYTVTTFRATTTGKTITLNGKTLGGSLTFNGTGGEWTLQENLSGPTSFTFSAGIFNANNYNVSAGSFNSTGANTRTLNMGSGTWTMTTSNGSWNCAGATNMTLNCGTSTIKIGNNPSSNPQSFGGNGFTYYDVEIPGSGNNIVTISGNNTFNSFISSRTSAYTIKFTDGTTNTAINWTIAGSSGNVITMTNTAGVTAATLTKSGGGTVTVDYANISYITATPSSTWSATNSTDSGNNTGWNFGSGFGSSGLFFGSNF